MAWSEEEFLKLCYLNVQEESPVRSQAVYLIMYHWSALCWALLLHGTLKWSARDLCSWYGFISKIQVKTQPGSSRYWKNISDSMVDRVVWCTENLQEDTYKLLFFSWFIGCFYRFDLFFLLSCSGEHCFVLYGGGFLGEALWGWCAKSCGRARGSAHWLIEYFC